MATIIFDFDDTLFNTKTFIQDVISALKSEGIPESGIRKTYDQMRKDYTFEKYVSAFENEHRIDKDKVLKKLNKLLSSKYVYKERIRILNNLKKSGNKVILLTWTDKLEFQKVKISKSGIGKYFEKKDIWIVQGSKLEFLKRKKISGEIYFVNDNKKENSEISDHFEHFKIIEPKELAAKLFKKI